jgi:hypothetical protein
VAFVKSGQIVDEIENVLEGIMKDPLGPDAVWASIEGKIRGHYLAAQTLPELMPTVRQDTRAS